MEDKCVNKNFYSSMLFIFPAIYAYYSKIYDVCIGSILCLITSMLYHFNDCKNKILKIIDIITVNTIAVFFTIECLLKIGFKFYANIMYFFALSAGGLYIYLLDKPEVNYHYLVHILAISGIMFFIKARKDDFALSPETKL